jgi:hypothetical protein
MYKDNYRKSKESDQKSAGKIKPLSKYGYADFMRLAANSHKAGNYGRAVDNCRLAVEMAERAKDIKSMADAYDLWINALMVEKKYQAIKKLCCEARTKLGNYLDLVYYEFLVARNSNDSSIARKLAAEFLEMKSKTIKKKNSWGITKIEFAGEIQEYLNNLPEHEEDVKNSMGMEK